jgi:hypothetical protein
MDPTVAATAASLIASGALTHAGEQVGDAAGRKVRELYQAVKSKLARDPYHAAALERVEESPDDARRVRHLEDAVAESMESDPSFGLLVERLVREAAGLRVIQATDSGAVAGGDIRLTGDNVAGRDLHIGGAG